MSWNGFFLITIVLPLAVAGLVYVLHSVQIRRILIISMSLVLWASAIWLHLSLGTEPQSFNFSWMNLPILLGDLTILAYIFYVAIDRRHPYLMIIAALQLIGLFYIEFALRPDMAQVPSLVIDRLAVVMCLLVSLVGSIICIYALRYMEEHGLRHQPGQGDDDGLEAASPEHDEGQTRRFFFWFVAFIGIMNGLIFANNVFWLYFFWEATTLCSFLLIGHEKTEESRTNALLALFLNSIGGLAMVFAIFLLANSFDGGVLSLLAVVNSGLETVSTPFLVALAFFVVAGLTKAAQLPFQNWLLGAMVAPTPVSALLHSSTMVKAGVYLILRLAPAYHGVLLSSAIAFVGGFTFFAASLLAVADDNAKRILAYSTVANLGLIVACCGVNTPLAVSAAVILIVFHGVTKALLFMGVGVIEHAIGSRNVENMEGLAVRMPAMMTVMTIGVFGMFLPPFGMLFGKWAALEASIREPLVIGLLVAGSTLTAMFWTKYLGRMLASLPGTEGRKTPVPMSGYYVATLGGLIAGVVGLSLGMLGVVRTLAIPAVGNWYAVAIQEVSSLNLAVFSWASYFNPEIVLGNFVVPEGLFPVGLL
ncbi:MAG: hypothetical protein GX825_09525, partial [Syntrophomonadaceae bacterium]|nr:hypothetical protein [Syntrophomonadaceae bacterium]